MPRPKKIRFIEHPPLMEGFIPFGMHENNKEEICIDFEEYEAIKSALYEGLDQENAAVKMNVSRPTFTRIYNSALKKLAVTIVEGRVLTISGGQFKYNKKYMRCKKCFKIFEHPSMHKPCMGCDCFGDNELVPF